MLLASLTVFAATSGAPMPALLDARNGDYTGTRGDWFVFLAEGLALDLLKSHFDGIFSATCCM